jgi:hypothetical protein
MNAAIPLLLINVLLGAADTLWYHEFKANLPRCLEVTRPELRLHAARDFIYTIVYALLALGTPSGMLADGLMILLSIEIVVTLKDFIIEDRDRPKLGGIAPGERVLHTVMAISYGGVLAHLLPVLLVARLQPTGLLESTAPTWLAIAMAVAAVGIAITGIRDCCALRGIDLVAMAQARRSASTPTVHP